MSSEHEPKTANLEHAPDAVVPTTPARTSNSPSESINEKEIPRTSTDDNVTGVKASEEVVKFKLYKRRWLGLASFALLSCIHSINWIFMAAVAPYIAFRFDITLDEVNWLGNINNIAFLAAVWFVPIVVRRFGLRNNAIIGAAILLISVWIRYGAIAYPKGGRSSYALLMTGQFLGGISTPFLLVVAPRYAQNWFDAEGRTLATGIISVLNPLGAAFGDLISPALTHSVGDVNKLMLYMSLIATAGSLSALLVQDAPPTPPSLSASVDTVDFPDAIRSVLGMRPQSADKLATVRVVGQADTLVSKDDSKLSLRKILDFWIVAICFGISVGVFGGFSTFISQIFPPYGYSYVMAGNFGTCLVTAGIIVSLTLGVAIEKFLPHQLRWVAKIATPAYCGGYFGLIYVTKADNRMPIYCVCSLIGASAFILLPTYIELAVEATSPFVSPDTASALLWASSNFFTIIFVEALNPLRAPITANPPMNQDKGLVFLTAWAFAASILVQFLDGTQHRRLGDESAADKGVVVSKAVDSDA